MIKRIVLFFTSFFLFFWIIIKIYICPFHYFLKIECASCGLTRSLISILKFNFKDAIYYNLFGIPFFVIMTFTLPRIGWELLHQKWNTVNKIKIWIESHSKWIVIVVILSLVYNNFIKKLLLTTYICLW